MFNVLFLLQNGFIFLLSTYFSNILIGSYYKLGPWARVFDTRNALGYCGIVAIAL
jgi:hypothetical protein